MQGINSRHQLHPSKQMCFLVSSNFSRSVTNPSARNSCICHRGKSFSNIVSTCSLESFHNISRCFWLKNILNDTHGVFIQKSRGFAIITSDNLAAIDYLRGRWINACNFQGSGVDRICMPRVVLYE